MSNRIYDSRQLEQITEFYSAFCEAFAPLDPHDPENLTMDSPLYIDYVEIVIRHRDDYTVARVGMDDFPFVEFTAENYGTYPDPAKENRVSSLDPDDLAAILTAQLRAHIRQEDTASGKKQ